MVFDGFRRSFDDLLARATKPEDRRVIAARMKDTLVQARVGLGEMRDGLEKAKQRLAAEERELETVRRRKQLAEGINDRETVELAAKYEQMHTDRAEVLRQKLAAQQAELGLAEREVAEMTDELKAVVSGADLRSVASTAADAGSAGSDVGDAGDNGALRDEIDSLSRARARADLESEAARKLEELKRRMGK
jgi:hypothetical protein